MSNKTQAIDTAKALLSNKDMSLSESKILEDIIYQTNYIPKKVLWRSDYYGTGKLGAIHYLGIYKNQKAVLKIQGVKPEISEIKMINAFSRQNKSLVIRPPRLLKTLPWNNKKQYEALIMEYVDGKKIIQSGQLQTSNKIAEFFNLYQEYKKNCINKPWLPKPQRENFLEPIKKAKDVSLKIKPKSPYRKEEDLGLINRGIEKLKVVWQNQKLEFMHGHFSAEDLIKERKGSQVVLFSNLFWKWKHPFYDAAFAYHWFIYSLAGIKGITKEKIETQRQLWLNHIYNLALTTDNPEKSKSLINAALLKRAMAGLLVDAFAYIEETNPVAEYMVSSTRREVKRLIKKTLQQNET